MVSGEGVIDVARRELIQLFILTEDDHSDIHRAKYRQLMCLFEEASLAFEKGAEARR